ncbi:type 1 pili tip component [Salinisphaera sp. Q1T1-3]|uniref:type 1 pili tip component n=1 Tax=Salinisphaera sp. Q1T1-3 TaxID=2321229 RepID=UPI000E73F656|nr:type 1 pili tip component [Salinisphaera sp. Q1T1-3]RJS95390.1 type 1 pili tip component [Salinisphaera sp. Q1T1-3]
MKISELVSQWQTSAGEPRTADAYRVRLPLYDAAKIEALTELFPGLTSERVITDLLATALDELTSSFSYEPGEEVTGYDELGDPMYADTGFTPRFQKLTKAQAEKLKAALADDESD